MHIPRAAVARHKAGERRRSADRRLALGCRVARDHGAAWAEGTARSNAFGAAARRGGAPVEDAVLVAPRQAVEPLVG